ncbi:MAG: hypothetical protein ACYTEX_27915 [Planctomycetota bacterium]|jgi:hypothetical protein
MSRAETIKRLRKERDDAEKRAELAESLITEIEREAAAFGVSKPCGSITAIERMIARYRREVSE